MCADTAASVNKAIASTTTRRRIGATRREAISPDLLCALNRGQIESATLAEWLAVDMAVLVGVVWRQLRLSEHNLILSQVFATFTPYKPEIMHFKGEEILNFEEIKQD